MSNRINKKRKKSNKQTDIAIKIISIITIIVVLIIGYKFINNIESVEKFDEEHEFFQYVMNQKIEYKGVLKLEKKDDITELVTDEGRIYLDSIPVYYKNETNKLILPKDMAIAFPMKNGILNKTNNFSKLLIEYGDIYIQKGDLKKELSDAFLYDGNDLYVFVEDTIVTVNGKEYNLSPLSYANVTYKGYVELYDYKTDTYTYIEKVKEDVMAETNKYKINLSLDVMKYEDVEQLLLQRIKNLPNLK